MKFEEAFKLLRAGKKIIKVGSKYEGPCIYSKEGLYTHDVVPRWELKCYMDGEWEEYKEPSLDDIIVLKLRRREKNMEIKKTILNDKERDILKAQISALQGYPGVRIEEIVKREEILRHYTGYLQMVEYIHISYSHEDRWSWLELPFFKKSTMFTNLELGKEYSLEELGLE